MKQRLYFILPDPDSARQVVNDLLLARIEERHIHFMAKEGTSMRGLHEASILQKTDIAHGAEVGLVLGGIAGILAGLIAILFPPSGVSLELVTILITALIGAAFGAWASSMVASAIPNSRLRMFENDIAEGHVLMMVDVPRSRAEEIRELIHSRHPEATPRGMESTIPAFP